MSIKKLFVAFLIFGSINILRAQEFSFNFDKHSGFYDVVMNYLGTILDDNKVIGYYLMGGGEEASRSTRNYSIQIYDENLKPKTIIKVTLPEQSFINKIAYNGSAFCCFFSSKQLKFFNSSGELTGDYKIEGIPSIENPYKPFIATVEIFSIRNKGFLIHEGKGYIKKFNESLKMVDNNGWLMWEKGIGKDYRYLSEILHANDFIVYQKIKSHYSGSCFLGTSTLHTENTIKISDLKSGNEIFSSRGIDSTVTLLPLTIQFDSVNNELLLLGQYKNIRSTFAGYFEMKITTDLMKIKEQKMLPYSSLIDQTSAVINDPKEEIFYSVKAIIKLKNNHFYLLQNHLEADSLLNPTSFRNKKSIIKLANNLSDDPKKYNDNFILELDENFKFLKVHVVDIKDLTSVYSPSLFISDSENNSVGSSCSASGKIEGKGGNKAVFYLGINSEYEVKSDQIILKAKPTDLVILPAKPGYVMLIEIFLSQGKINCRLVKMDI